MSYQGLYDLRFKTLTIVLTCEFRSQLQLEQLVGQLVRDATPFSAIEKLNVNINHEEKVLELKDSVPSVRKQPHSSMEASQGLKSGNVHPFSFK